MVWAIFQHYSPYYRIIPSVIGIVTAIVALRQARETETGLAKSLVALIVNGVVGAIAAVAVLQLVFGLASGGLAGLVSPSDYSAGLEEVLADDIRELGHATTFVVCPDEIPPTVGAQYACEEYHTDGTVERISVEVLPGTTPSTGSSPDAVASRTGWCRMWDLNPHALADRAF